LPFSSLGYLDAGLHHMSHSEFETDFVTAFPHSTTRTPIFAGAAVDD
jgi:hypothetical protein